MITRAKILNSSRWQISTTGYKKLRLFRVRFLTSIGKQIQVKRSMNVIQILKSVVVIHLSKCNNYVFEQFYTVFQIYN